jgi:glutamate-1-semialdehyde 2,1-aminomutase
MLDRGVYLAPSGYEAIFPSLAHADADLDHTLAAVGEAAGALGSATAGR